MPPHRSPPSVQRYRRGRGRDSVAQRGRESRVDVPGLAPSSGAVRARSASAASSHLSSASTSASIPDDIPSPASPAALSLDELLAARPPPATYAASAPALTPAPVPTLTPAPRGLSPPGFWESAVPAGRVPVPAPASTSASATETAPPARTAFGSESASLFASAGASAPTSGAPPDSWASIDPPFSRSSGPYTAHANLGRLLVDDRLNDLIDEADGIVTRLNAARERIRGSERRLAAAVRETDLRLQLLATRLPDAANAVRPFSDTAESTTAVTRAAAASFEIRSTAGPLPHPRHTEIADAVRRDALATMAAGADGGRRCSCGFHGHVSDSWGYVRLRKTWRFIRNLLFFAFLSLPLAIRLLHMDLATVDLSAFGSAPPRHALPDWHVVASLVAGLVNFIEICLPFHPQGTLITPLRRLTHVDRRIVLFLLHEARGTILFGCWAFALVCWARWGQLREDWWSQLRDLTIVWIACASHDWWEPPVINLIALLSLCALKTLPRSCAGRGELADLADALGIAGASHT